MTPVNILHNQIIAVRMLVRYHNCSEEEWKNEQQTRHEISNVEIKLLHQENQIIFFSLEVENTPTWMRE